MGNAGGRTRHNVSSADVKLGPKPCRPYGESPQGVPLPACGQTAQAAQSATSFPQVRVSHANGTRRCGELAPQKPRKHLGDPAERPRALLATTDASLTKSLWTPSLISLRRDKARSPSADHPRPWATVAAHTDPGTRLAETTRLPQAPSCNLCTPKQSPVLPTPCRL